MTPHPYGLRKRGRFWHYRFEVRGTEYAGSTKCETMGDAKEIAAAVQREAVRGAVGLRSAPRLYALVDEWLKAHRRSHSTSHMTIAKWALTALGDLAKLPLTSLTTTRITAWRVEYLRDHRPATANMVLRYLGAWCRWAASQGWLAGMPYSLKPVRWQQAPRPVLRPEQVAPFLAAVDHDPSTVSRGAERQLAADAQRRAMVRAAVRFMLGLGLREAEVLTARWEWLQGEAYTVGKAKGKRNRTIPAPAWVMAAIAELPRADLGLMFPGPDGRPHQHGWLRKALARGCRAVGLPVIGAHRLRATFATLHAGAGTPLTTLQELMGHASPITTRGYVEEAAEAHREAQDGLSKLLGLA